MKALTLGLCTKPQSLISVSASESRRSSRHVSQRRALQGGFRTPSHRRIVPQSMQTTTHKLTVTRDRFQSVRLKRCEMSSLVEQMEVRLYREQVVCPSNPYSSVFVLLKDHQSQLSAVPFSHTNNTRPFILQKHPNIFRTIK